MSKKIIIGFITVTMAWLGVYYVTSFSQDKKEKSVAEEINKVNQQNSSSEIEKATPSKKLKMGESYSTEDLSVTLNGARFIEEGEYNSSQRGRLLAIDVSFENKSSSEVTISSLMNFQLKENEDGEIYNQAVILEGQKGSLNESVSPGVVLRGEVVYDVPESQSYVFYYSEVVNPKKIGWKFSLDEVKK